MRTKCIILKEEGTMEELRIDVMKRPGWEKEAIGPDAQCLGFLIEEDGEMELQVFGTPAEGHPPVIN